MWSKITTALLITAFTTLVLLTFGGFFLERRECKENPRGHRCPQREQTLCEDAGGLFHAGGWGANNCVFPPSN